MDSLDDLLAKMQSDFKGKQKEKQIESRDRQEEAGEIETMLAEMEAKFQNRSKTNAIPPMSQQSKQSSTDDLLAQMQAEFGNNEEKQPQKREPSAINDLLANVTEEFAEKTPSRSTGDRTQIEKMLSEVRGDFKNKQAERRSHQPQVSGSTDRFLSNLKADFQQKQAEKSPPSRHRNDPKTDDLLANLKNEFHKGDIEDSLHRQQQELREKREREWARQQRRKALKHKAEEWLKQLDPYSGEGLWFSEFAEHYPNQIEAAIDYLETVWDNQK
ncbi:MULTISPECIES: hypothetical protein [Spirulina sp. CCY15215]|uniref:salt stress protein, Slr1339 family n=1 Tax=Spirulina sp. CCY15215 TaxID=2767591 RepID=UPI00194DC29D|nr:hypothetical protein [Spirulina major]